MSQHPDPWLVDPDDPRAPPQEVWDRLTDEQRQRVVDSLPSEFEATEAELPGADELIVKLEGFVNDLETRVVNAERRAEEEARRAEEQARRAEEQARRADEMRSRLDETLAELERLKKQR